jgi:NAD+ synthase
MKEIADRIAAWLKIYASGAGAEGFVVGLSGGIDSACTAVLCQRAVGKNVLGALLPCHSAPGDAAMAQLVVDKFALQAVVADLGPTYDAAVAALPPGISDMARANLKPRLRMAALYALAQSRGYLVAGTGNKSELEAGYFTKYGDGGVDVEPLGALYKWQVRELARVLDVPQPIIDRPPSAGLWVGQTDEDEMGITYDDLDATLTSLESGLVDDIDPTLLDKVQRMKARSAHKRGIPPVCPVG